MNTLNPAILLVVLGAMIGTVLSGPTGAAIVLWRGCKGWKNRGKALIITLPETPQTLAEVEWRSVRDGYLDNKQSMEPSAEKGDKDRVLANGPASYPSNLGPLHLLTTYGANLVAPSKQEAAKTIEYVAVADWLATENRRPTPKEAAPEGAFTAKLQEAKAEALKLATRFQIWDPRTYYKACRESVMQKLYNSTGGQGEPWYAKAAVVLGVIAVIGVLAVLGVTVVKVLPALQAAHGG